MRDYIRQHLIRVAQKVHQHWNHCARRLREADRGLVDRVDQHRTVLTVLLTVLTLRFLHLLLQHLLKPPLR